jgi:hypothetical protein
MIKIGRITYSEDYRRLLIDESNDRKNIYLLLSIEDNNKGFK